MIYRLPFEEEDLDNLSEFVWWVDDTLITGYLTVGSFQFDE